MSSHTLYDVEHEYEGNTFVAMNMLFNKAVDFAAECLREGSWPVTLRPAPRRREED